MRYFEYAQNNSFGTFVIDDNVGIGPFVWIEAIDTRHANARAESLGIYFDGCAEGLDCPCCGDRWYPQAPAYGDGEESPHVWKTNFIPHPVVYVHPLNGPFERIKLGA
jgi:hypothetical protein